MRKPAFFIVLSTLALVSVPSLATQSGVESDQLSFGRIIITDNSVIRSCTMATTGVETCDVTGALLLMSGQLGIYRLSGFDPNTAVGAMIDQITPMANAVDGTLLDIANFKLDPAIDQTPQTPDASGNMTLKIGATLSTRAGTTYAIAPYHGTYRLTITY